MATHSEQVVFLSAALTPAAVGAATCAEQSFTLSGIILGDCVVPIKPTAQAGLGIAGARCSATGTVNINFVNPTAAPITPTAAETYLFAIIRS